MITTNITAPIKVQFIKEIFEDDFVELIVSECVDVLIDVLPSIVPESKDGIHPAWHIKDHFGFDD